MKFHVVLNAEQLGQLQGVLQGHAIGCAKALEALTDLQGANYKAAQARFIRASALVAAAESAEPIAPAAVVWPKLPHTPGEIKGAVDAGLDPDKELGPHDPRARDPSCVHGRKFTEECKYCAGEIDPIG
jgi:hypothetical protein